MDYRFRGEKMKYKTDIAVIGGGAAGMAAAGDRRIGESLPGPGGIEDRSGPRHRHRRCRWTHVVSPGGNRRRIADELFRNKGNEELAVEPRLGALVVLFRQVAQLSYLLEAFEYEFDLPSDAIPLEHVLRRKLAFGKGREDNDVLGIRERLAPQLFAGLARALLEFLVGLTDGLFGLSYRAYSSRNAMALVDGYAHRPGPHVARSLEAFQMVQEVKRFT